MSTPPADETTASSAPDWRMHGVRIVHSGELDMNTPQTEGMSRAAAITHARTGASKLWAGTVMIRPNAKTGAHHHGALESVIYVVRGRARMRWGDRLEFVAEAGPGDFIYVPPYVPHQEINAAPDEPLECVLVRSGQDAVVVNLDIPVVEKPETVYWVDPIHARSGYGFGGRLTTGVVHPAAAWPVRSVPVDCKTSRSGVSPRIRRASVPRIAPRPRNREGTGRVALDRDDRDSSTRDGLARNDRPALHSRILAPRPGGTAISRMTRKKQDRPR